MSYFVHPTAIIEDDVRIGEDTMIWHHSHIRSLSTIGRLVSLGKDVFVDKYVKIGDGTRIQNGVSIYNGVEIEDWVFIGPNVTFTNDVNPRSGSKNWKISETKLKTGCSIGAGTTVLPDVILGEFSLIGAGSLVSESIPPFHLAYGMPARIISKICACGMTRLDLSVKYKNCVLECCKKNLKDIVLEIASLKSREIE